MKKVKKIINNLRSLFLLLLLLRTASSTGWAQLQLVPLTRTPEQTPGARTSNTELTLPFWDDFSFTPGTVPLGSLWRDGGSVWVNDGLAIDPPSIRVATFDGLDATGKPYNVNDVLAKGFADRLESHIIRLDQVDASMRGTVYLSFFYQATGKGESPDLGDLLQLQFKTAEGRWETVWQRENEETIDPNRFYQVIVPVAAGFFHETFQFRFQNFARLSGPYDTWHVDYIFLHQGRSANDLSYPDRALASSLGSVFQTYHAIPKKHFFLQPDALADPPFRLSNLRLDLLQPLNYFLFAEVTKFANETTTAKATLATDNALGAVDAGAHKTATASVNGLGALLDASVDSLKITLKLGINTKDNLTPAQDGDYDATKYQPIDFRNNDTLRATYWLSSHYAYDDGTAEYGAALNQPGAMVAYEFNLMGVNFDTISFVDLYFPRFGDETARVIELQIRSNLSDNPEDLIHSEVITLQRNSQNIFWRKRLSEPRRVGKRFFVGWKQSSAAVIAIGLDKNTDSGSRMFFNTNGTWEQNTKITGSLMMRPVLGRGKAGPNTGLAEQIHFAPYPNPSTGTIYLSGSVGEVMMLNTMGQPVAYSRAQVGEATEITIDASSGVYILRATIDGQHRTAKLMIVR
jgi:hypothetical protein